MRHNIIHCLDNKNTR